MAGGSTDAPGEQGPHRRVKTRVRVRLKEPERVTVWKRLRAFYTRHGRWFGPVVMLVLGTVAIWLAMKLYIGE